MALLMYSVEVLDDQDMQEKHTFFVSVKGPENIMKAIERELIASFPSIMDYNVLSITLAPTCSACREQQPNQFAHMEPGGCLYYRAVRKSSSDL